MFKSPLLGATGVFREATECGFGPTKGSESPFTTEFGLGVRLFSDRQLLLLSQFDANDKHFGYNQEEEAQYYPKGFVQEC